MAILSIQSHVAYGYVGNRSATFPLQLLGREVWAINTVQFSNHTGYGAWRGTMLGENEIDELVLGIEELGVLGTCEALLSGYLGNAAIGDAILRTWDKVRAANPKALFCCDPVMGDYGPGYYVRPGIPELFRSRVVPAADILTPNQFELESLTGLTVTNIEEAARAVDALHERGPGVVLVTSCWPSKGKEERIDMLVSDRGKRYRTETPRLPIEPNGAGDLSSALFLAHYLDTRDAASALEATADSVYSVFERTWRDGRRELSLIQSRAALMSPGRRFHAIAL